MDSNFRYTGMHWLQGSNTSLTEIGICPQKKAPCIAEQTEASGFSGLLCMSVSRGFVVRLWNYGIAAQFSGKREGSASPLTLFF